MRELLAADNNLWLSRSWTTRSRRPGEAADAYHFVSPKEFDQRIAEDGFLEWAEFLGNKYGTPLPEPPAGKDVLLEIDVQGAQQVIKGFPEALLIFLEVPSPEVQAARLRGRGDSEDAVTRRIQVAAKEAAAGRALGAQLVINDELHQAVRDIQRLIALHRDRRVLER